MPSEVEKLRALLAEARDELLSQHDPEDCCEMAARIDAALAEPREDFVAVAAPALRDELVRVLDNYSTHLRERDEARAEREQAKDQCAYLDEKCSTLSALCDSTRRELDEARANIERLKKAVDDSACDGLAIGFVRGAGAMREAIYLELKCPPYDGCNDGRREEHCDSCETADMIFEIPIPEDK